MGRARQSRQAKATAKLRHKTNQAAEAQQHALGVASGLEAKTAALEATVTEQNLRMGTLASNSRHWRKRHQESEHAAELVRQTRDSLIVEVAEKSTALTNALNVGAERFLHVQNLQRELSASIADCDAARGDAELYRERYQDERRMREALKLQYRSLNRWFWGTLAAVLVGTGVQQVTGLTVVEHVARLFM